MKTAQTILASLNRSNVIRAYSGKIGCMCGCKGVYYADRDDPKDNGGVNTVSTKQVNRIITELKKLGGDLSVEASRDEVIFCARDEVRNNYRNYVLYVKADGIDLTNLVK